jgi:hypothetical protein
MVNRQQKTTNCQKVRQFLKPHHFAFRLSMSISFDWNQNEEIEFTFFWLMTNKEPPMSDDEIFYD